MRDINKANYKSTIQQTSVDLRGIYLPADFIAIFALAHSTKHQILIDGVNPSKTAGTLQVTNFIGGLAKMYRAYELQIGDEVGLECEDGTIIVIPPPDRLRSTPSVATAAQPTVPTIAPAERPTVQADALKTVFARQNLRHVYIPEFAPANLSGWTPETETDVFLVFGMLSENTDFRYCCGVSQELVEKLEYKAATKPDAILIDRTTDEYLMAEFKVYSSDFTSNHHRDDVDVLVCWIDDASEKSQLPPRVMSLKELREKAVKNGEIPLDELS